MNALARAFRTDVASLTQANQAFSQILSEVAGKQTVSFDQSQTFDQDVTTSTNVRGLIGVQLDVYEAPDGTFYVNARMNRSESAARYSSMVQENVRVVRSLMTVAERSRGAMDAYTALNFAYNVAVITDNFQGILEVLDPRTVSQKPSYGSADAVKLLLQEAARAIVIRVQVTGDVSSRVSRAFTQAFSERGFRTAATGYTHTLSAALELEAADFGANQRTIYIRHSLTAALANNAGVELFSYSGNDRSGAASESEARQGALRKVEAIVAEGEFAQAFDSYLFSLLK
jgi:hypothetical protein